MHGAVLGGGATFLGAVVLSLRLHGRALVLQVQKSVFKGMQALQATFLSAAFATNLQAHAVLLIHLLVTSWQSAIGAHLMQV